MQFIYAKDASEFGFAPDNTGVENTAALQKALDSGGTVRVTEKGRYKIAGTVYIGDNTSLKCDNGVFGNGGIRFLSNDAMSKYGYGRTQLQLTGCRFKAKGEWHFIQNPIKDKQIDLKMSGSIREDSTFKALRSPAGLWNISSDLLGLDAIPNESK